MPSSTENTASSQVHQARLLPFLAALAFFLSTIEFLLPRPLPFLRLGLANIPLLLAVDLLDLGPYLLLLFVKVLGMNLLSGTLFSYLALFSLLGTLASGLAMRGLRRLAGQRLSYLGLCVAGALASNGAQLLAARLMVFGAAAFYMLPLVAGFGLASGLALGGFTNLFARNSAWLAARLTERGLSMAGAADPSGPAASPADSPVRPTPTQPEATPTRRRRDEALGRQRDRWQRLMPPLPATLGGLSLMALILTLPGLPAKAAGFLVGMLLAALAGRRMRPLNIILVMAGIVLAHLLVPAGRVLWQLGSILVSQDALIKGLEKALAFQAILLLSRAAISPTLRLPGRIGALFAAAMRLYEQLASQAGQIRPRRFFPDVDSLLTRLYQPDEAAAPEA